MSDFRFRDEEEDDFRPPRRSRGSIIAIGVILVVAAVVAAMYFGGGGNQPPTATSAVKPTAAAGQQTAVPKKDESAVPGLVRRAGEGKSGAPGAEFDFGPAPALPALPGFVVPTPKPTPEPSLPEKAGGFIWNLPVIGGAIQGVAGIIGAIDWVLKNIWLVVVILVLLALVVRVPVWTPALLLWELFQTIWTKKSARDAWDKRGKEFEGSWAKRPKGNKKEKENE